jgi:hypothetical protein
MRVDGNGNSAMAAAQAAARQAAERAAREAAERAAREAAERAAREAAQKQAQAELSKLLENPVGKLSRAFEKPPENINYSGRGDVKSDGYKELFNSKLLNSTPRNSLTANPDIKSESKLAQETTAAQSPSRSSLEQTADRARDFYRSLADKTDKNSFLGKTFEFVDKTIGSAKLAVENAAPDSFLAKAAAGARETWKTLNAPGENKLRELDGRTTHLINLYRANETATVEVNQPPPPPAPDRILELANRGDSAAATELLHGELKNAAGANAAADRQKLIDDPKVREALRSVGRDVTTGDFEPGDSRLTERRQKTQAVYTNLSRAAELAGSDGAKSLAREFAQGVNDNPQTQFEQNQFNTITASTNKDAISSAIANGDGAAFSANLAIELNRAGKSEGKTVGATVEQSLVSLREDFADKSDRVKELNQQLAQSQQLSGLDSNDPRLQHAVNNFLDDHKQEFDEFEEAGRKLASTLNAAHDIQKNPADLPARPFDEDGSPAMLDAAKDITKVETVAELSQTRAGIAQIANALEKQGEKKSTFMDLIPEQLKKANDVANYAGTIANALTKAASERILQLANTPGNERQASRLMRGLVKNHAIFGIKREAMNGLAGDMRQVLSNANILADTSKSPAAKREALTVRRDALASLDNRLRKIDGATPYIANSKVAAGALKGLGFVVSLAGQADAISTFKQAGLTDKIKTIAGGVGLTGEGASIALQVFGKNNPAGKAFLGKLAPGVSGITALLDGFAATKSLTEGNYADAAVSGASATGGAILTVNALRLAVGAQALPVAGQIAGVVLTVGALGGGFIKGKIDEGNLEQEYEKFLNDTGLKPETSDRLSDVSGGKTVAQFVNQIAPELGITPRQFVEHLQTLSNDDLEKVVEMAHNLKTEDTGEIEQTADSDAVAGTKNERTLWFDGEHEAESITGAANWLRVKDFAP